MSWASGWGADSLTGPAQQYLQKVELPIVDDDACEQFYSVAVFDYNICVGEIAPGKSVCPVSILATMG